MKRQDIVDYVELNDVVMKTTAKKGCKDIDKKGSMLMDQRGSGRTPVKDREYVTQWKLALYMDKGKTTWRNTTLSENGL